MARITVAQAAAWAEQTKLDITTLDTALLDQVENDLIGELQATIDTSAWTSSSNTPSLVQSALAKLYVAWIIDRQYSEDEELSSYATLLRTSARVIIDKLISGEIEVPGSSTDGGGEPSFYPSDESSAQSPTWSDTSLGPAAFSMGQVF